MEPVGELEASSSSLGRGRGVSLLSPVKSKHLEEPSHPSPPSGESSSWGELELHTKGEPTVRFSLEVEEEDKLLSVLNRLELLGSKILKSRFSCDLLISAMFLIEDIFTASGLGLVDIKEDRLGSSLKTSSGMAAEKTQKLFQFGPDIFRQHQKSRLFSRHQIKGAASSVGITSKEPTCIDRNSLLLTTKCRLV